jgi:hypothetical protein
MSENNTSKEGVATSNGRYIKGMWLQGLVAMVIMLIFFGSLWYRDNQKMGLNINIAPIMKLACSASQSINPKHYVADACIVCCTDDRFTPLMNDFARARGYVHIDWIRVAGGSKDLNGDYLSGQIVKLAGLHHTKMLVISEHIECGAFGGEKDENVYARDLQRLKTEAEDLLRKSGHPIPVTAYLAKFDGLYEVK